MTYLALPNGGTEFKSYRTTNMPHVQEQFKDLSNFTFTKKFYITSAQLLALNATPITVLGAPGANLAIILRGAMITKPAGTAYAGIAAGEDLAFRYTDGSGAILGECETTGFLDQATLQSRFVYPIVAGATQPLNSVTPVANAVLKLHMLTGEITTGTSPLLLSIQYSIMPVDLTNYVPSTFIVP